MALTKRNYISQETVITAQNLNEIQDAVIALENKQTVTSVNGESGDVSITIPTLPTSLKNPYSLILKVGTTEVVYDGSTQKEFTVTLPSAVTVDTVLSATSTNPVQNKVIKAELDEKLPLTGGTLTGNLTGKHITGTWLQSTSVSEQGSAPTKIAVFDSNGWLYYRSLTNLKTDLGVTTVEAISNSKIDEICGATTTFENANEVEY